jgi:hypothetical protein
VFGLFAENHTGFIADVTRSGSLLVPVLLDPQCTGSGASGPPDVPCTSGREVYQINLPAQTFSGSAIPMSCAAVAESEDSWSARRAGTNAQLLAQEVAVIAVPEPAHPLLLGSGSALLLALARARRRRA